MVETHFSSQYYYQIDTDMIALVDIVRYNVHEISLNQVFFNPFGLSRNYDAHQFTSIEYSSIKNRKRCAAIFCQLTDLLFVSFSTFENRCQIGVKEKNGKNLLQLYILLKKH